MARLDEGKRVRRVGAIERLDGREGVPIPTDDTKLWYLSKFRLLDPFVWYGSIA